MYNKSEIFKMAWAIKKSNNYTTFSSALFSAWAWMKRKVEEEKDTIAASELEINDIVEIEYGEPDNLISCTVTDIRVKNFGREDLFVVKAIRNGKHNMEFCLKMDRRVKKIGVAVQEVRIAA